MASGSGGPGAATAAGPAATSAAEPIPTSDLQGMVGRMTDSISQLQRQMAVLYEDSDVFIQRCPTAAVANGEQGPAVRELAFTHAQDADRRRRAGMEVSIEEILRRMETAESNLSYYCNEAAAAQEKVATMEEAIATLRSDHSSRFVPSLGVPRREEVTGRRGFDKLRVYKGSAAEWKDWKFKLTSWLGQSSPAFETLIVKLDYSETEPTESEDGLHLMGGTAELTTDEEWCGEQLYLLLVQKCEGPALDIIRNLSTMGTRTRSHCLVPHPPGGRRTGATEEVRDHRESVPVRPAGGRG